MLNTVQALLRANGIQLCAPLSLADCRIQKPYLLERVGITEGTAFLFAVPYYTTSCDDSARNISIYSVSRDYHSFFAALFDRILPDLQKAYPENRFAGFTDHSPIAEAEAAAKAGLGVLGSNRLFLTKEHSSFVFLGEIITDAKLAVKPQEMKHCTDCGRCREVCPVGLDISRCLSALTQKKGELTPEEITALREHKLAWGCDRCQQVCPVTEAARERGTLYSKIPFFTDSALPHLTAEGITEMSEEDFKERAYSWRGREVILRNLRLLKGKE